MQNLPRLADYGGGRRGAFSRLSSLPDGMAWVSYEKCFSRLCATARGCIDFFCRHLTMGDVGAALSHLRLAERAHSEGLELQLVVEDDARLSAEAVPALLREVELLRAAGVAWDIIYLLSANYSHGEEPPLDVAGSRLRVAAHRKAHHVYALSARAAAKLATCGFRDAVLPYDDFVPALHSQHPRDDVMELPSVCAARGASPDGFVALTFPDEDAIVTTSAAGSDSKAAAGSWSSVLLGDSGAQADVVAEAGADEGGVAAALRRHGHATVALDAADLATLEHAEQKAPSSSRCRWRRSAAASPTRRATGSARASSAWRRAGTRRGQTASTGTWCAARPTRSRGRRIRWPASAKRCSTRRPCSAASH